MSDEHDDDALEIGEGFEDQEGGEDVAPEIRALLPNGIGMKYDEVIKLLAWQHKTAMSMDDPVMMLVTLMNAHLAHLKSLHERHNQAVGKLMSGKTAEFVGSVKTTCDALGQTLAASSVEAIREIFSSHAEALQGLRGDLRWGAAIIAVSAVGNLVMLVLR